VTLGLRLPIRIAVAAVLVLAVFPGAARAASPQPGPPITIERAKGPIAMTGDLSSPGWQGLAPITQWYETNVGDNVEPQVKNTAYLTYDDQYFYAGFVFEDPHPHGVRAPIGDHDNVNSSTDYAGVIIDSHNDGKTAQMFLANPAGVQYDALTNDATGEDNSPDFYWDSMGKITPTGWTLEIRIPFSSLRYSSEANPTWGILLYRNYPRDHRYQFFSARLPRDVNCFICNSSKMGGLSNLPHGSHLVVAPFTTASQTSEPKNGLGTPLEAGDLKSRLGGDLKWSPASSLAIDATVKPDFSQIESDAAQIVANERFALFYPEKRPFFLEGVDLLSTPFQAVYTRTITAPEDGLRATGKIGSTAYTALATRDQGGGLVILPGPFESSAALQEFKSDVEVVRLRRDVGPSFVSLLATGREIEGGGHNGVFGPDFVWRPKPSDQITGQGLWSDSKTPNRPDLAGEWDGRRLSDYAARLAWAHNTQHPDWYMHYQDIGPDFRADEGFIPQVGYREGYFDGGWTIRNPKALLSRVRFFSTDWYDVTPEGTAVSQRVSVGSGADGKLNSFTRLELNAEKFRIGGVYLDRFRPRLLFQAVPSRMLNFVSVDSYFGEEIDFANARKGHGATFVGSVTIRPSDHIELAGNSSLRWVDVSPTERLFTAQVQRLRATYSFSSRAFLRLIGQYVETRRDTSLYTFSTTPRDADFSFSALAAYKMNWQTVFYVGFGDARTFADLTGRMEPSVRQAFAKISYAWQR
jgi:hypothetical protein